MKRGGYQAPVGELSGYKTLVTDTSSKGLPPNTSKPKDQNYRDRPSVPSSGGTREQALPITPKHEKNRDKHQPTPDEPSRPPVYNAPPSSGGGPDEKSIHKDRTRTKSQPGEEYGHPYIDDGPAGIKKRRTQGPTASMYGPLVPGSKRQKEEKGPLKIKDKRRYRPNRMKVLRRMKIWWRRNRRKPGLKRDRKNRKKKPSLYERRPGGGFTHAKERSKKWRKEQQSSKAASVVEFWFVHPASDTEGRMRRVSPDGLVVYEMDGRLWDMPVGLFLDEIVFYEEDLEDAFLYLDLVLGESPKEDCMEGDVLAQWSPAARVAAKYNIVVRHRPRVRMKKMRGKKLKKRKDRYRQNKAKEKLQAKKRRGRLKNRAGWKKQQRIRRRNPQVFRKRRGQVLTAPEIAFVMGDRMDLGYVHGISPMTGIVGYHRRYGNDFEYEALPVPDFMASVAFLTDFDIEAMFELIDVELGPEAHMVEPTLSMDAVENSAGIEGVDCRDEGFQDQCEKLVGKRKLEEMSPSELAQVDAALIRQFVYDEGEDIEFPHEDEEHPGDELLSPVSAHPQVYGRVVIPPDEIEGKTAEMLYEKVQEHDPDTWHDRGQGWTKKKQRQQDRETPTEKSYPYGFVDSNPGSAKVIPEGFDYANKKMRVMKQSTLISGIERGTGEAIHGRASGLRPRLKKVDVRNGMWTYAVPASKGGNHTVKVKALRKGNMRNIAKLDVYVACSCPFWQWQGPEYHAKQSGYLYGKARGTASVPVVKDPENQHGACKHVLAVLAALKGLGPLRKEWGRRKGSVEIRFLADRLSKGETRILSAQRVAARYRGRQRRRREG